MKAPIEDIEYIIKDWISSLPSLEKTTHPEQLTENLFNKLGFYPLVMRKIDYKSVLFRARANKQMKNYCRVNDFSYPPNSITKRGRCNLDKHPVFYSCTDDIFTALNEVGIEDNERAYLSVWDIIPDEDINTLTAWQIKEPKSETAKNRSKEITRLWENLKEDEATKQWISQAYEKMCNMIFLGENHIASSIFCHSLLYGKKANIDAIIYPDENRMSFFNIAISTKRVKCLKIWKVYDIVRQGTCIGYIRTGITMDGQNIMWKNYNHNTDAITFHPLIN